jgi:hypothetical protein
MGHKLHDAGAWFARASHCYVEKHQGCPWCGGSYRVFQRRKGPVTEYFCNGCDFRAGYDAAREHFYGEPGCEPKGKVPSTMHAG